MRRVVALAAPLCVAAASCIALWSSRETLHLKQPSQPAALQQAAPEPAEPTALPLPPAPLLSPAVAVAAPRVSALADEPSLMSTLRALGDSEPERSLQLAREAERRFPGTADAAERGWYVCKSLVNLERFYEAREEARLVVAAYPGTAWAMDVERHLLVNPLDLPGDPAP